MLSQRIRRFELPYRMARRRTVFTATSLASLVCTLCVVYLTGNLSKKSFHRSVSNWSRPEKQHTSEKLLPELDSITFLPVDVQPPRTSKVKIIIVTYMRSGSTFTGDIFDSHSDVFYVFEPLHSMDDLRKRGSLNFWDTAPLDTVNMNSEEKARFAEEIIQRYLNCSFRALPPLVLMDQFQILGNKTSMYRECVSTQPGILGPLKCLPLLQRLCFQSKVTVIKTLRFSLEDTLTLMEKDPEVKVVYLLRDPRGTLLSQGRLNGLTGSGLVAQGVNFCRRVEQDLSLSLDAMRFHPGRVLRVRYEDIALSPVRYAKKLLDFAGLTLGAAQLEHLRGITSSNVSATQCQHCVKVRSTNSSVQAFAWRERGPLSVTTGIDKLCSHVYSMAGYRPLGSETELRDRTVPSMFPSGSVQGFG